jgi:hypothetical protein
VSQEFLGWRLPKNAWRCLNQLNSPDAQIRTGTVRSDVILPSTILPDVREHGAVVTPQSLRVPSATTMVGAFASGPVTQFADDLFMIDLRKLRGGPEAVLSRIPKDTPGVYAWYRSIVLPDSETTSAEAFAQAVVTAATAPHCAERGARLPPAHEILLRPFQVVSARKQKALVAYCRSPAFRRMLAQLMEMAILFQQPLYVGKAQNLIERIEQHLAPRSELRNRLDEASIDIDAAKLLVLTLEPSLYEGLPDVALTDVVEADEATSASSEPDQQLPLELVMEEVLSRLFLPSFTIRYG